MQHLKKEKQISNFLNLKGLRRNFAKALRRNDFNNVHFLIENTGIEDRKRFDSATYIELKKEVKNKVKDKQLAHSILLLKRIKEKIKSRELFGQSNQSNRPNLF